MACITKRRNRWIIDFYDQHGKRRWITLPENHQDPSKGRTESYRRSGEQENVPPQRQGPFVLEVAREWIEHKKLKLRETTWEVYEGQQGHHRYGREVHHRSAGSGDEHRHLAESAVTLGQILNYAVRHKYIEHNPLREAERPGDHVQRNEALQTQLGHASPSITLNVYAHLMNPTNQEAACRVGKFGF